MFDRPGCANSLFSCCVLNASSLMSAARWRARRIGLLLAVCAGSQAATAVDIDRQTWLDGIERSLSDLWDTRVVFGAGGRIYHGFAQIAAADGGVGFWGAEGGSLSDSPLWDFERSGGTPGVLYVYAAAYEKTGNQAQLRRAEYLAETLMLACDALGGGWFQDGAIINGQYRNIGVWGSWGNRRHTNADIEGLVTLDDATSASCGLALLKLYEQSPDPRYLASVRKFADRLIALPQESIGGGFAYGNGGFPQILPAARALTSLYNQNQDARNPDGPYMAHKTNNDAVIADALIMLMEFHRIGGDPRDLEAIRLTVDYLLDRHAAYGYRGWAQQYHHQDDRIAWGRSMEPPAFVTTETNILQALTVWWHREADAARRDRIAFSLERYARWLRALPRPASNANYIWRYYNHDESTGPLDVPVFGNGYVRYVGVAFAGLAGAGQGYVGEYDLLWANRLIDGSNQFDMTRLSSFVPQFVVAPFQLASGAWIPTAESPSASVPRQYVVDGQERMGLEVRGALIGIHGVIGRTSIVGVAPDRDSDGFADATENSLDTDDLDSDQAPWREIGDCNCDGFVTINDIQAFVLVLANPGQFAADYPGCSEYRADTNGDGVVSAGDIGPFVELMRW